MDIKWNRTLLLTVVLLAAAAVIGVRIWCVNQSQLSIPVAHSQMGERVELAGDFIYDSQENTSGYSVEVEAAEIMDAGEYLKRYGKKNWDESQIPGGAKGDVLVLTYNVTNVGNDSGYLDMVMLMAVGASKNHLYKVDYELWEIAEPSLENSAGLVLKENSSYTTHLPFSHNEGPRLFEPMLELENYHRGQISDHTFELYVSNAPTRKAIDIQVS